MRKLSLPSVSLLLAFAMASSLLACSSSDDDRSLVIVNVVLGPTVEIPAIVRMTATQSSTVVRSADFGWTKPGSRTMQFGLYIPSGVTGQVFLTGVAHDALGQAIATSAPIAVDLVPGAATAPVSMPIGPQDPAGNDGGLDTGPAADTGATTPEVGGPMIDAGIADRPVEATTDGLRLDVPPPSQDVEDDAEDAGLAGVDGGDAPAPEDAPQDAAIASDVDNTVDGSAPPTPSWEAAVNVENDPLDRSYSPVIVVDPVKEHVYVAWVEATTVKVRRWHRGTAAWGDTVVLDTRGDPNGPAIGADANGSVMVLWGQNSGTDTSLDGVWVARTTDGTSWSLPTRIGSGEAFDVNLAVARNGIARAVYNKRNNGWPLYTAYFDGTAWTENPTPIDPNELSGGSDTRVAVGADGDGLVIYAKNWGIVASALTGQTFTTPTILDPNYETATGYNHCLAVNRKGDGMVIWTEASGANNVLLGRTYRPGQGWGPVLQPIVSASYVGGTGLALDEEGIATVLWQQPTTSGGNNLLAKRGPASGPWGQATPLETDNVAGRLGLVTEYAFPSVAVDASGNVLAVWRKDRSTDAATTYGAYGTRFAGQSWLPETKLGMKTGFDLSGLAVSVADSGFGAATFSYFPKDVAADSDSYNVHVALFR